MSTQKSNIEKFEDFELTPENAKKVDGGGVVVIACREIEVPRCAAHEGKWCGPRNGVKAEIRSEVCPWVKDAVK